jgi:hypothetical protein
MYTCDRVISSRQIMAFIKGRTVLFVCNGVDNRNFLQIRDQLEPKVLKFEENIAHCNVAAYEISY